MARRTRKDINYKLSPALIHNIYLTEKHICCIPVTIFN